MESRLTTVLLMTIVAVSTLLAVCIPETEARPSRHAIMDNPAWQQIVGMIQEDINDQVNECEASPEVRSLCLRCAKQTKSNMAYPLCCLKADTKGFCINFLNFGLNRRNDVSP